MRTVDHCGLFGPFTDQLRFCEQTLYTVLIISVNELGMNCNYNYKVTLLMFGSCRISRDCVTYQFSIDWSLLSSAISNSGRIGTSLPSLQTYNLALSDVKVTQTIPTCV